MAEEKLERANFYGDEKIIAGRGGAAGGSGGGGLALTGGAYVPAEGGITSTNRWLRFDFNDPNHRSLIILGGTSFTIGENIITIDETTSYSLSDYISEEGADYYVFINADGRVIASTLRTQPDGYMFIGQFHTLCNGVPSNTTGLYPASTGTTVGTTITLYDYFKDQDLDFANFYTKTIDAVNDGTPYAAVTVLHPLQSFNTGDILPESVWCLNFHPACKNWDGMLYCNSIHKAVDIYLQSGTGVSTSSEYGSVVTMNRVYQNFVDDSSQIGKMLIKNYHDFAFIAYGSNVGTVVSGDSTVTGGKVDTAGRRMISFIGCEDCCGCKSQFVEMLDAVEVTSGFTRTDGRGLFGGTNDTFYTYECGGFFDMQATERWASGPRFLNLDSLQSQSNRITARSCCDISIV